MIFRATNEIADRFKSLGLDCKIEETKNASIVHLTIKLERDRITIMFISMDDGADVAIHVYGFATFPEYRMDAALRAVNTLNSTYRFVAFSIDAEKPCVNVRADLPAATADVGGAASEMLGRVVKICDEAYPELMKAIWSK